MAAAHDTKLLGRLIPIAIGLALLTTVIGPPLAAATVTNVAGSARKSEEWGSAGPGYTALNQHKARSSESNVLLIPNGGATTKVNPDGTNADWPIIEMANTYLGDVLLFSQWRGRGQGDIKLYDLGSGTFVDAPAGVNTRASENRPSLSGAHPLFGRVRPTSPPPGRSSTTSRRGRPRSSRRRITSGSDR